MRRVPEPRGGRIIWQQAGMELQALGAVADSIGCGWVRASRVVEATLPFTRSRYRGTFWMRRCWRARSDAGCDVAARAVCDSGSNARSCEG